MPEQHARLSPSAAGRWLTCPGSVALCEAAPKRSSDAADEGTACHTLLYRALTKGASLARGGETVRVDRGKGVAPRYRMVKVTEEMAGWVREVWAWVRDYYMAAPEPAELLSETRAQVGRVFGRPDDVWGTIDVLVSSPAELLVLDAKFGYDPVEVTDNPQLLLYAFGAMEEFCWVHGQVRLAIHQPQAGGPHEQVLSAAELESRRPGLAAGIERALTPGAPLVVSDRGCKYCNAAGTCPELQKQTLALAAREFAMPEALSRPDLVRILDAADRIRAALKSAEEHAATLLAVGQEVPGYKLVYGNKHLAWKDPEVAAAVLGKLGYAPDDYAPRKMLTPSQVKTLVGRQAATALADLSERPRGEPTLAPDSDPRDPVAPEFPRE